MDDTMHKLLSMVYCLNVRAFRCLPGLDCFNNVSMNIVSKFPLQWMFDTLIACKVCTRCPDRSAISIVSFSVNSFRLHEMLSIFLIKLSTSLTSHVKVYLGSEGLRLKTPRRNRFTKGCSPTGRLSIDNTIVDKAERVVFMLLYPTPLSNSSDKNVKTAFIVG